MRPLKVAFAIFTRLCTYHHELIIERLVPSSPLPKETLYPLRVDPRPLPFWPQATSGHRPKVWLYRSAYSGRSIQTDPGPCGLPGLASCTRREGFGVRPGPHSFLPLRETPPCGCVTLCLLTAHARPGGRLVPAGCGERRPDEPPVHACAGSPRNCAYPAAPHCRRLRRRHHVLASAGHCSTVPILTEARPVEATCLSGDRAASLLVNDATSPRWAYWPPAHLRWLPTVSHASCVGGPPRTSQA